MKNLRLAFVFNVILFACNSLFAQVSFYKVYLNDELDSEVFDIKALSDGGYAMVGITDNNGFSEVALTKLSCDGNVEWAKTFGNSSTINNVFNNITEADNGDIVFVNNVGSYQNYNILIARISPDGTTVWKQRYGGNRDDIGRAIVSTPDGHFVITGSTNSFGTDSGSFSYYDVYFLKIDGNTGDIIWSKTFGNASAIDEGFALQIDAMGNLYSTGRFLVGGTFYTYILKMDGDGNVTLFKGFGAPNHRTYGYDIKVAGNGDILITGSTTIAKIDHTSPPDVFLIKTDDLGVPKFNNIYFPVVGNDNSESGSSLVLQENGGYGIGVPTMSFTNWTSGFVPNKNAIYSTDENGLIEKAILYNQGGSHYTRLRKALDGGYILSNFSNFYSTSFEFLPLIIKTDSNYESGCNTIEVTSDLSFAVENWDVQDISFTTMSGGAATSHGSESSFSFSDIDVQCIEIPEVEAMFTVSPNPSEPLATFDFTNTSMGTGSYFWDFGDGTTSEEENPTHSYIFVATYDVCLTLYANCDTSIYCTTVTVDELPASTNNLLGISLECFPNPVTNTLFLTSNGQFSGLQSISLFNANGQLVLNKINFNDSRFNQIQIDLQHLPDGVYFLKTHWQKGIITKKVIKSNH